MKVLRSNICMECVKYNINIVQFLIEKDDN